MLLTLEPEPDYQLEVQVSFYWATESNQVNQDSGIPTGTACCIVKSV